MTLIQRFGSALNLNVHLHMLVLDGAYLVATTPPVFLRIAPPRQEELQALVERIAERIGRVLERQGLLARDAENGYLALEPEGGGPLWIGAILNGRRHPRPEKSPPASPVPAGG